jgi:protein TonB
VAENRFLQSFCAVAASSVLVSGTLFLLTTTAPWTPPPMDASERQPEGISVAIKAVGAGGGDHSPSASDQLELGTQPDSGDRTLTASTEKEPDFARALESQAASDVEAVAALGTPLNAETADGGDGFAVAGIEAPQPITAEPTPVAQGPNVGEMSAAATTQFAQEMTSLPPRVITAEKSGAATLAFAEVMTTLPVRVIAAERSGAATAELAEQVVSLPPRVIAGERSEAASDEIAAVLAGMPPAPPAPNIRVAALVQEMPSVPGVSDKIEIASLKVAAPTAATSTSTRGVAVAAVVTPPPPLPRRKPEAPPEPKIAAASVPVPAPVPVSPPPRDKPVKAEAPKQAVAQQTVAQQTVPAAPSMPTSTGPWKPMTLAPADKPALAKPATARPSGGAYASQVWSRLARHKPRAGQRGSASVAFTIGELGVLRAARIARSSGNARIDQLALATVRNAAPFPAPPSGAVSYTIRIDFQ